MRNFSVLLIQLVLAALVGYGAARFAVTNTGDVQSGLQAPVPQPPATASPAPAPPSPSGAPNGVVTTQTAAAALSISYRSAVQRAAPSVVTVYSARTATVGPLGLGGRRLLSQGLGSGVLIDAAGFVVTNNHVVQDATELAVALPDGTLRPTKVIGVDPDSDLALLKIDAKGLQPIAIGDVKSLAVGDVVLAVGNPLGVGQTVTQGIVSALGRKGIGINPIENFIQTDAAINPGNSGGALIDTAGRLVGINSAILSRGGGSRRAWRDDRRRSARRSRRSRRHGGRRRDRASGRSIGRTTGRSRRCDDGTRARRESDGGADARGTPRHVAGPARQSSAAAAVGVCGPLARSGALRRPLQARNGSRRFVNVEMLVDVGYAWHRAHRVEQCLHFTREDRSAQRYAAVAGADLDRVRMRDDAADSRAHAFDQNEIVRSRGALERLPRPRPNALDAVAEIPGRLGRALLRVRQDAARLVAGDRASPPAFVRIEQVHHGGAERGADDEHRQFSIRIRFGSHEYLRPWRKVA